MKLKEFQRKGGKARWKNISKEERSKIMSSISRRPKPRKIKVETLTKSLSTGSSIK